MTRRTSTLKEVTELGNLERAWRWIRSNPDRQYKKYFRESYSNYSLIESLVLKDIAKKIDAGTYEPSHGCKIFLPKASGVLRPYTLLTVEDQIVYQAMVNVIAEHLYPHVRSSYYISTFGNLYAGKSNTWFYRKWSTAYKKFNDAARDSFRSGLTYSASFDLTACYDSLDHKVLRHFLKDIKCDDNFITLLTTCLSKWTGTEKSKIYHNHGIPQGPLASGLLSEVVLKYFDIKYGSQPQMRYMRYVDDIRLFATSEKALRKMLIRFDRLSKDIGLFPQSSKIEIHEVKDIEEELKSVSSPVESSINRTLVDQVLVRKRILELTERYKVKNYTRFKYVLAHALPSSKINDRIWRIYKEQIANFDSVFRYFQRYEKLPKKISKYIIDEIKSQPVYSAITAELINTLRGRATGTEEKIFKKLSKELWKPRGELSTEIVLHSALARVVVENNLLTLAQLKYTLTHTQEWYVRVNAVQALDNENIGPAVLTTLLNEQIKDKSPDVACAAALIIIKKKLALTRPLSSAINSRASMMLKEAGVIKRMPNGVAFCSVDTHFNHWLDNAITGIDWKTIFGTKYQHAESLALNCRMKAGNDITSWVLAMDVFNDLLLGMLYQHDPTLGVYQTGNMGGFLNSVKLSTKYPKITLMMNSVHDKRSESNLSHAYTRRTGRKTGPIKYRYYSSEAKRLIKEAFAELASKW